MERLNAHADAVNPRGSERSQLLKINCTRVRFECDFSAPINREMAGEQLKDFCNMRRLKQRGRSTSEEDRFVRGLESTFPCAEFDFLLESLQKSVHECGIAFCPSIRRHRIEVAVDALMLAERNMEIKAGHRLFSIADFQLSIGNRQLAIILSAFQFYPIEYFSAYPTDRSPRRPDPMTSTRLTLRRSNFSPARIPNTGCPSCFPGCRP